MSLHFDKCFDVELRQKYVWMYLCFQSKWIEQKEKRKFSSQGEKGHLYICSLRLKVVQGQ